MIFFDLYGHAYDPKNCQNKHDVNIMLYIVARRGLVQE
ncbi:hypothetical protein BN2364_3155 [Alloalcanivorax xenomutans]|nr:hypothetical protein BN2364_3155 [Alloalcanivorax xenomutans]